jgi:hypothetical protein
MAVSGLLLLTVLAAAAPGLLNANRSDIEAGMAADTSARVPVGKIDLSLPKAIHDLAIASSAGDSERIAPVADRWVGANQVPGVSLGPLRTEFGGLAGRHMQLATMRLEGVSVFGANIGGSIDSRSARVTFSWPSGP